MFKIGEFSKLTQVSIRMLRYYDETGLLKPAQIDSWTGYRLYSVEQIPMLNRIVYLRDSGFRVEEIVSILDQNDDEALLRYLDLKRHQIEQDIRDEEEKLRKIQLAKKGIEQDKSKMHYNVAIKSIPSYHVLSVRRIIQDYYAEGNLWRELSAYAARQHVHIAGNTFSIYHDIEYKERDVDVELCVPVKESGENCGDFAFRDTEPVPIMACSMVYGPFSNIAGAYLALAEWLSQNSRYRMPGQSRQIVHRGPWSETNPEKYLTEIQIALDEAL